MTDSEIKTGLQRLMIFGRLEDGQVNGYLDVLKNIPVDSFNAGVKYLISNYEKHRFPLPADILNAAGVAVRHSNERPDYCADCTQLKNRPCLQPCIRQRSNAGFWMCWRLCGYMRDPIRRKYYLENRMQYGSNIDDENSVKFYELIAEEIRAELTPKKEPEIEEIEMEAMV
jgi:hypothetical protein